MFERFTVRARQTVVTAQEQARRLGDQHIGTQHLLLGLIAQPTALSARLLADHGLDAATAERILAGMATDDSTDIDADALAAIGIDLNAVRDRIEAAFGPGALDQPGGRRSEGRGKSLTGHLPLTRRAKKSLEIALREARRLHHGYIGDGHLLLGLIRADGTAQRIIVAAGIAPDKLRLELEEQLPPDVSASAG